MKKQRPAKHPDVLEKIDECLSAGRYFEMPHAQEQMRARKIIRPEMIFVLQHGHHEKRKDEFKEECSAWNYAIRGQTLDKRELRIVVSFDKRGLLVITAIDLEK